MIDRRLLLKGAAAMTGDGLARPINAPGAPQPLPGVQPGTIAALVTARRVIILGASGALFAYDVNQPAAGELIASITGQQETDGTPGNLALAGISAYVHRIIAPFGYYAGNLSGLGVLVYTSLTEAGPWSLVAAFDYNINQGATGAVTGARLANLISGAGLVMSTATTFLQGTAVAQFSGCQAVASNPVNGLPETWHSLGTLANYTVNVGRYRLTPDGHMELDISVSSAGANAANTSFSNTPLAAPYQLGNGQSSTAYPLTSNRAVAAGDSMPRVIVGSNGGVSITQTAAVTALLTGQAFVPLN